MSTQNPSHRSVLLQDRTRRYHTQMRLIIALVFGFGILIPLALTVYANVNLSAPQCNDSILVSGVSTCGWTNGMPSGNTYTEGSAMPQYAYFTGLRSGSHPNDVYTYTWIMSWSNAQWYHGYDWIVSDAQAIQLHKDYVGTDLNIRPCYDTNNSEDATCIAVRNAGYTLVITMPTDNYVSGIKVGDGSTANRIAAFESKYGSRSIAMYASAAITGTPTVSLAHVYKNNNSYDPCSDGCDNLQADSYIQYTLVFTTAGDSVLFEYAGHFAIGGNQITDKLAWGWDVTHNSYGAAGQYPQGSWHVSKHDISAANLGSMDNQARVGAPNPYPITSGKVYTGTYASDLVTMTVKSGPDITGTLGFYVCRDTSYPYTDTLTNGCPQTTNYGDIKVSFIGTKTLTVGTGQSTATSALYAPPATGHYCFLTFYTPTLTAISGTWPYNPTSDTNGDTECFDVSSPTPITLYNITAVSGVDNALQVEGFSITGLILGLLGLVAVGAIFKFGYGHR